MSIELQRARNRQMFIFLLVCVGMVVLLGKLYFWQILQSSRLADLANAEHIQNQILNAPRGLIYDAQGHILATNVVRDDVYIEPIQFAVDHPNAENFQFELSDVVQQLHQILPQVSEDKLNKAFGSGSPTVRVAEAIEPAQSQKLRRLLLPDIFLEPRTWRIYPAGQLAAQILGYVQDGKGGMYGLERQYNTLLAGKPGSFTAETDLNGNPLTVGPSAGQMAVNGADLRLTIDSTIQYIAQTALTERVQFLHAQSGTVVVINAHTGAIVAMAGEPTFDPNHYGNFYNQMGCENTENVYFNPALSCAYEPGSTMKVITMAAALDQKLITPDTSIYDPGYLTFSDGTPTVTNWDNRGYGQESMTMVLAHSANVGAAYVAYNFLKPGRYYPYLTRFGFGQAFNIAGPEASGQFRTPQSPGWTISDLTRQSFGQSITATPLQVAMAYQAVANGGVMMRPYLVASINDNGHTTTTQPQVKQRVINTEAAKLLTEMLVGAANFNQQATFPGYSVAVKTGTATTQGLSDYQTVASMAGFVPASNPQFVILVKIDRPQGLIQGGNAAGPVWKAIAQQLMWYYDVPPDQ